MDLNKMRKSKDLFCELCICACVIERKRDTIILTVCLSISLSLCLGGGVNPSFKIPFKIFSIFSLMLFNEEVCTFSYSPSIKHKHRRWQNCSDFCPFVFIFYWISRNNFPQKPDVIIILKSYLFFPVEVHIRISPKIIKHVILQWNQIYKKGGGKHHLGPPPTTPLFYCTYTITCEFSFGLAKQVLVIALSISVKVLIIRI